MDSFFQFHVDAKTWDYYMGRMLLHLFTKTGRVYMAVCAGGSALSSPSGGGLRYSQLLAELPSGLEIIIPVICGNDCYKKGKIVAFDNAWLVDVAELCEVAATKSPPAFRPVRRARRTSSRRPPARPNRSPLLPKVIIQILKTCKMKAIPFLFVLI